jgi:hypothetical protein
MRRIPAILDGAEWRVGTADDIDLDDYHGN